VNEQPNPDTTKKGAACPTQSAADECRDRESPQPQGGRKSQAEEHQYPPGRPEGVVSNPDPGSVK
jgi:hypothetical protein